MSEPKEKPEMDKEAFLAKRRAKNWTLLAILAALVALFYTITILKMA